MSATPFTDLASRAFQEESQASSSWPPLWLGVLFFSPVVYGVKRLYHCPEDILTMTLDECNQAFNHISLGVRRRDRLCQALDSVAAAAQDCRARVRAIEDQGHIAYLKALWSMHSEASVIELKASRIIKDMRAEQLIPSTPGIGSDGSSDSLIAYAGGVATGI